MAQIDEAFNRLKLEPKMFQKVDYFFTQRNLTEDRDYIDDNMNRKIKKVKVIYNFLSINIPTITEIKNIDEHEVEEPLGFDIEIYGDEGYHYKGTINSHMGNIPIFMIPLKKDKKIFVNIVYKYSENSNTKTKHYVNFIDVPKRFQDEQDI